MISARGGPPSDTIFALASAPGRAAIAVVRLSGPACADVCRRLTGRPPPPPRAATLRRLADLDGASLDRGLVLWFPGPGSFTGEDVLEFQLHGGRGVLAGTLDALAALPGLRAAEPGEFSRRAFLNGRLDLTAVEGLADLIAADTKAQVGQALRQLEGALGRRYAAWREALLGALAQLEAAIDFAPEEADVPADLLSAVGPRVAALSAEIADHLADDRRGERLRDGLVVAVVGPPNAGKSSLVNLLARREVAIVTAQPGTTRDVLEVGLELAGYPVTLLDTAGLREAAGEVEAEGVRRARARAAAADLRLLLFDGAAWPAVDEATAAMIDVDAICVLNKIDLVPAPGHLRVKDVPALGLSCLTGSGFEALLETLGAMAADRMVPGASALLTRSRHRAALKGALDSLACFNAGAEGELALMAEDLRLAAGALGRITGQAGVEEILDRIFAEFCIGK